MVSIHRCRRDFVDGSIREDEVVMEVFPLMHLQDQIVCYKRHVPQHGINPIPLLDTLTPPISNQ